MNIHKHAKKLIEYIGDIDKDMLLEKLMSCFIEKEVHNIGSQIGFDQNTVDDMMQSYIGEQKATRNNNRRKKRR
jgi:ATP-dependent RNA helicase DeaD